MSDAPEDNVIPFPVKFSPEADNDGPPQMRDADHIYDNRCRHRKTTFDRKARTVVCDACGVNVDPFAALEDIVAWIRLNEHRYDEMKRADRIARLAADSHLKRITQGEKSLLIGRCWVSGYHVGPGRIPTEEIALGDYVSVNRVYRARRNEDGWSVQFYDPAHGLKDVKTIAKPTLQQVRAAVQKHWLWLNNNAKAAGLA